MTHNGFSIQDFRLFQWMALGALLLVMFYPLIMQFGWVESGCPFIGSAEHPCPSCGLTSGWGYLYHGNFSQATESNRHVLSLFALVLLQILWRALLLVGASKIKHPLKIDIIVSGCLVFFLAGPYLLDLIHWLVASPMLRG